MDNKIIKVIKYFSFFGYYPTLNEIYTFLEAKISRNSLEKILKNMIMKELIKKYKLKIENSEIYTPPQYSIRKVKILELKVNNSKEKLKNWRFRAYIKLISLLPQIKLVGLSGSISMMNANENDDIDLFMITDKNRLFTGRLIALILAQLFGLRRIRGIGNNNNKICLNLFFDEKNMKVPKFKQTEFVGHEVLQMKPIVNKEMTYERFLASNKWVFRLFPNAKQFFNFQFSIFNKFEKLKIINYKLNKNFKFQISNLGGWLENKLKKFQLRLINRHRTTEIITSTQLWFHPDDFEKKLPNLDKADSI